MCGDGRDCKAKEAMAGEAQRWDSGEEQPSPCYWNTEERVQGWGGGRDVVSMIKKVEMEAAVRSWKALDTMFGTCT